MSTNNTVEIERKFLLLNDNWRKEVDSSLNLKQSYISRERNGWLTRLRIIDNKEAEITIKGPKEDIEGSEYNLVMDIDSANDLWTKNKGVRLEKVRHIINNKDGTKWEIDEFKGEGLKGLIFAEIELPDKDYQYEKPSWLGLEVSGTMIYSNDFLASNFTNIEDYTPNLSNNDILKDFLKILNVNGVSEAALSSGFYKNVVKKEDSFGSNFTHNDILSKEDFLNCFANIDFRNTGMSYKKLRVLENIIDDDDCLPFDYSRKLLNYDIESKKKNKLKP